MLRTFLASLLLVAAPAISVAAAQTPPRVSLDLADVSVAHLATELSTQLGEPVVVDTDAQAAAGCAHLTLSTGGPQDAARVVALLAGALRPSGLSIARDRNGVHIGHIRGAALPAGCIASTSGVSPSTALPAAVVAGIHTRPDGTITVTAAARDAMLADQTALLTQARIIPQLENGIVVGVRLYGIRATSLLTLLGFQNGDTLRRVNGVDVATPEHALEAYSRLRAADHFDVEITRRGQPQTLHYVIAAH